MQVCWQTAKRKISEHSQVLEDGEDHFLPFIQARIRKLDFHSEDRGIASIALRLRRTSYNQLW